MPVADRPAPPVNERVQSALLIAQTGRLRIAESSGLWAVFDRHDLLEVFPREDRARRFATTKAAEMLAPFLEMNAHDLAWWITDHPDEFRAGSRGGHWWVVSLLDPRFRRGPFQTREEALRCICCLSLPENSAPGGATLGGA